MITSFVNIDLFYLQYGNVVLPVWMEAACRAYAQQQRTPPSRFNSLSSSPARGARKTCHPPDLVSLRCSTAATMFLRDIEYIEPCFWTQVHARER